ncbi:G-protein coupled receptor 22-like [Leucoraja erinacea]|uniref:G-protein coupled receptor 22-like n=1 Tax=Leucoraja erinaceus TaxID=7782 RepID=UPI00245516B8|nr:G-protein coupled receptor 22-like [Leucoraja erinacea]
MDRAMELDEFVSELEKRDGAQDWYLSYPLSFQVSLGSLLLLELVLGLASNLTVLVLYGLHSGLADSVSTVVTVSLHVLDTLVCLLCVPFTTGMVLRPPATAWALACCFHEACVALAGVGTAANVLLIGLDRYDISVRPSRRLLTAGRAMPLLAAVWTLSLLAFSLPFLQVELLGPEPGLAQHNLSLGCGGDAELPPGLTASLHLLLQVPCFCLAAVGLLATYSRILRALNVRFGRGPRGRRSRGQRRGRGGGGGASRGSGAVGGGLGGPQEAQRLAAPPPPPPGPGPPRALGVQASVSAIMALRRAVRRHRERRRRQRRVLRMSLVTVGGFVLCWAPVSALHLLQLVLGPSEQRGRLRLCALALAYAGTLLHPLLYAFARQKMRRALRGCARKRVLSVLQVDPLPGATVIHNSWLESGPGPGPGSGPPAATGPAPPAQSEA